MSLLPKVKVVAPRATWSSLLKEKKKIILALVEMMRKTFFKTIEIGIKTIETEERERRLISEYNNFKWGFIAKEQGERVNGWKITKKKYQVEGTSHSTNLAGILLKASQAH